MPKGGRIKEIGEARANKLRSAQLRMYTVADSGCWLWSGGVSQDGYGKVKRYGKTLRAHRVFYEHFKGPLPEGMWVLHTCDNPLCVNPNHLWAGTQLENEQDKDAKGRRPAPASKKYITYQGVTQSILDWSVALKCSHGALKSRLTRGWPVSQALTHPFDPSESQRISQQRRLLEGSLVKNSKGQYTSNLPEVI